MSLSTDIEIENIKQLAALMELEDELEFKLSFVRDKMTNLISCMSEEDFKKALELYNKKIGIEPWMN